MKDLSEFIQSLSSADEDMLYQVFDSLYTDYSEEVSEIQEDLKAVKEHINEINKKRSAISEDLSATKHILGELNEFMVDNDGDLSLNMLHYILSQQATELSNGVQSTRPNELLDYKFYLKEKQRELKTKQKIIEALIEEVSGDYYDD